MPSSHLLPGWSRWLVPLALLAGLILSVISALHLCTSDCAAAHEYRLWGFKFEQIGIPFFVALNLGYWIARNNPTLLFFVLLGLLGGLGAEVMFIYAQKAIIGHWCPVCLAIAGTIFVATLGLLIPFLHKLIEDVNMNANFSRFLLIFAVAAGFTSSFFGFAKYDRLAAAEDDLKTSLAFGNQNSPVEVYFFTDWLCPACRQIEPSVESMFPKVTSVARFYFVDMAIHPETLNFTPYNLSFITYNKKDYFELRNGLSKLSLKTKAPTDHQIEDLAKKIGVKFKELSYGDASTGIKYFKHLSKQFNITKTPTLVIVNRADKKGKKLEGEKEITEANVLKTIETLKNTK